MMVNEGGVLCNVLDWGMSLTIIRKMLLIILGVAAVEMS